MSPESKDNKPFPQRLGSSIIVIAWIILLVMLTLFFNKYLRHQHNPNENVISYNKADYQEVKLQRNRYGHYVASGEINGKPVEFILDTGATMVSIPERIADTLRLERGPVMEVSTANGTIPVYATRLDEIQLGDIVLRDIRASINPYMDEDGILLGMSFLKHLEFSQRGEQLTLRQYP